jgi:predicted ester cyclase
MSAEKYKALGRRLVEEAINEGNLAFIDEFMVADYDRHDAGSHVVGRENYKQLLRAIRVAFPDLHETIEVLIAEGDMVALRGTFRGTHNGEFRGIAPTGKVVEWTYTGIIRLANGKMVESWSNSDMLGLMQQLGAIPE